MSDMALLACCIEACMAYDDFSFFRICASPHPSGRVDAFGVSLSLAHSSSSQPFSAADYSGHWKGYEDNEMLGMGIDKQAGLVC